MPGFAAGFPHGWDALIDRLRVDSTILAESREDFARRQSRGEMSPPEAADYAAWISALRARMDRDCLTLINSRAGALPADLPCDGLQPRAPGLTDGDIRSESTSAERADALNRELDESLADFDDMLLQEQGRVRAARPPSDTAGDSGGSGAGSGEQAGADQGTAGATTQVGGNAGVSATIIDASKEETREADVPEGSPGYEGKQGQPLPPPPEDIPDGRDDDVVARQLREAAERERDPVLRARLWEEYRRYKQGQR